MYDRTLVIFYPGCIAYEIMLATELLNDQFPVTIATPDGLEHCGSNGMTYRADLPYEDIEITDYHIVLIPGGDPQSILDNMVLDEALRTAVDLNLVIGAICAGPLILAKAGILKGRKFTHGYGNAHKEILDPYWKDAIYEERDVVIDGKIITAKAWAYIDFAVEVACLADANVVKKQGQAEQIKNYYKGFLTLR